MNKWNTQDLVEADKKYVWHPFTSMAEWCAADHEPIVLVEGQVALLRDSRGREYIAANSSIWTNIHGHNHPHINAAIRQLEQLTQAVQAIRQAICDVYAESSQRVSAGASR